MEDHINVMHRYRDAIVSEMDEGMGTFEYSAVIHYYGKIKEIKRYERKECVEISKGRGADEEEYLRLELEEILSLKSIAPVEYGVELITYTTMYLLKNAETVHELSFKSNSEIEVYKILKRFSKLKGMKIVRFKDYFKLGNIKIGVLNSKDLRVNDVIMGIENLYDKVLELIKQIRSEKVQ